MVINEAETIDYKGRKQDNLTLVTDKRVGYNKRGGGLEQISRTTAMCLKKTKEVYKKAAKYVWQALHTQSDTASKAINNKPNSSSPKRESKPSLKLLCQPHPSLFILSHLSSHPCLFLSCHNPSSSLAFSHTFSLCYPYSREAKEIGQKKGGCS